MALLFACTLLFSAMLLFSIQPIVGRLLLPKLGGSPAVWTTCLVFFQATLLAGYLYCHILTKYCSRVLQVIIHLLLATLCFFTMPIQASTSAVPDSYLSVWLLKELVKTVGFPLFIVAITSPLLQKWFTYTNHRKANDPYFLSVVSNAGCMLVLIAYPFWLEVRYGLSEQVKLWQYLYVAFLIALVFTGIYVGCQRPGKIISQDGNHTDAESTTSRQSSHWGYWLLLAFIPASLLSGVTQAITTDIAPVPMLWLLPLILYLLTFIIAFLPNFQIPIRWLDKALCICMIAWVVTYLSGAAEPVTVVVAIHLISFFLAALVCHVRLSNVRPTTDRLTHYYLLMSLGGVLGGAFNAFMAPLLFRHLGFWEYPIFLVAPLLLRASKDKLITWKSIIPVLLFLCLVVGLIYTAQLALFTRWLGNLPADFPLPASMVRTTIVVGFPSVIAYLFVQKPLHYALGLSIIILANLLSPGIQGKVVYLERSTLGQVKITLSPDHKLYQMVHGNTVHGRQRIQTRPEYVAAYAQIFCVQHPLMQACLQHAAYRKWDDIGRPLAYYYPTGPAGKVFEQYNSRFHQSRNIGVVGLGTGALVHYARPNEDWTVFELDPVVIKLAQKGTYFRYLQQSRAHHLKMIVGDARIRMAEIPDHHFDLLVLDAFSSDAIPTHLITQEAFALYLQKLRPGGVILLHISNLHFDLAPVVARIAQAQTPPLAMRLNDDLVVSDTAQKEGKFPSRWVILARSEQDFGWLATPMSGFTQYRSRSGKLWTDDRVDLWSAIKLNQDE
ncbi:MAG: fused MFS/spermidine synthase [Zavarzinella sp.]